MRKEFMLIFNVTPNNLLLKCNNRACHKADQFKNEYERKRKSKTIGQENLWGVCIVSITHTIHRNDSNRLNTTNNKLKSGVI